MIPKRRGTLLDRSAAPARGEHHAPLADLGGVVIEQIISSAKTPARDYLQDHDEWVVVLEGGATVTVDGESFDLLARDWLLLPARIPHRLVRTEPGTVWLAVHAPSVPEGT